MTILLSKHKPVLLYWPHSFRRLVVKVPPELWQTETRLQQERGESKKLNVDRDIDEKEGDEGTSERKQGYKYTVVTKIGPPPEVVVVKIWKGIVTII